MSSILIVDDEAGVRASLGAVLRDEGYSVDAVDSGEACLEQVARQAYDVILLDIWLPGMTDWRRCRGCASGRSTHRS